MKVKFAMALESEKIGHDMKKDMVTKTKRHGKVAMAI